MCGIVGYTGAKQAAPVLLAGLKRLEYRGYDSAGIAVQGEQGIAVVKAAGKIENLIARTQNGAALTGGCGIGHTRWATHGAPDETNAHPHASPGNRVVWCTTASSKTMRRSERSLRQRAACSASCT